MIVAVKLYEIVSIHVLCTFWLGAERLRLEKRSIALQPNQDAAIQVTNQDYPFHFIVDVSLLPEAGCFE